MGSECRNVRIADGSMHRPCFPPSPLCGNRFERHEWQRGLALRALVSQSLVSRRSTFHSMVLFRKLTDEHIYGPRIAKTADLFGGRPSYNPIDKARADQSKIVHRRV